MATRTIRKTTGERFFDAFNMVALLALVAVTLYPLLYVLFASLSNPTELAQSRGLLLGPAGFSKLVAIKCLHQEYASEPEFVSMFLDEARLASTIHHPNVVASLDVVAEQGELLVVMEYVHGETLAGLLRLSRQKGQVVRPAVIARVLCDALEGLHGDAFEWLERSISLGNANRPCFENDPNWAGLRKDPRFVELMEKV